MLNYILIAFNAWLLYTSFRNGHEFRKQLAELNAAPSVKFRVLEALGRFCAVLSTALAVTSIIRGD